MRRARIGLLILALILFAACTSKPSETMPTLAVLPTSTFAPPSLTPEPIHMATLPPAALTPVPIITSAPMTASETPVTSIAALVGNINVTSAPGITLRRAPSESADVIAMLPGGAVVSAQQRTSDNVWIGVVTQNGMMGWVKASDVFALVSLTILPAVGSPTEIIAVPTTVVLPATSKPTIEPSPSLMPAPTQVTLGDIPAMEQRLKDTPIFQNLDTERVRAIFQQGQSDGNRANVFTTVGDSNTTNGDFLQPIGMGADTYCTWGSYNYLHATVAYFSTPLTATDSNSFVHHSIAAGKGYSTASVLDPFWAPDDVCGSDSSPLTCEIARVKPSVAIIMLGNIDVSNMGRADYDANIRQIVQTLIQNGVIPVLTTFVVIPDRDVYARSLEFNMSLLDLAQQEQTPLINLWAAAQTLPRDGIGPDGTHLKAVVGSFCSFDGAQGQDGGTLRNLLTLQALDQLRQNVLTK